MQQAEDFYFTHYTITFKVAAKDYVCEGTHYYPTKKQYAAKDYYPIIMDDIASEIVKKYKADNKIIGTIMPKSIKIASINFSGK